LENFPINKIKSEIAKNRNSKLEFISAESNLPLSKLDDKMDSNLQQNPNFVQKRKWRKFPKTMLDLVN